jgi:acyl carrier protein phosphodiesterase
MFLYKYRERQRVVKKIREVAVMKNEFTQKQSRKADLNILERRLYELQEKYNLEEEQIEKLAACR